MRKIISFMHISLDGFVAGTKGEMDWIKVDDEIFDFVGQRINKTDTAVCEYLSKDGDYWPTAAESPTATKHDIEHSQWYKMHTKLSCRKVERYRMFNTQIISENIKENIQEIKRQAGSVILLFGSPQPLIHF